MNTDTSVAAEATTTVPAQSPMTPEDYAIALLCQNLALGEALANLSEAVRGGEDTTKALETADQAMAFTARKVKGAADFGPLAKVLGAHAGWMVVQAAKTAFEQALREEFARDLPTIAILDVADDMQDGDDGSSYASFEGVDVTFKDGTKLWIPQDHDGDGDEFSLADGEQLLRNEPEDLAENDRAEQAELVAKYAALFGVEPSREALITCLETISAYIGSYYWHNARQGGSDRVYEA